MNVDQVSLILYGWREAWKNRNFNTTKRENIGGKRRIKINVLQIDLIITHTHQHMYITEIKIHTKSCALLHVSAINSPPSGRSKNKAIKITNTLVSYA